MEITVKGMRFHARVGILPHERTLAQPIVVDLTAELHDSGDGIVDYRGLYECASTVLAADPIDFLEEIADRIASAALALSTRVARVRVAVRKPHVPMPGPVDHAEVVIERRADA